MLDPVVGSFVGDLMRLALMFTSMVVIGCPSTPSRYVGLKSPQPLSEEEVGIQCRSERSETARCRITHRWGGEPARKLPLQPPSPRLSEEKVAAGTTEVETDIHFEAPREPDGWGAAPLWRHPLASRAFGLRTCAFAGGCRFDVAVVTTGDAIPFAARFDGVDGDVLKTFPGPKMNGRWLVLRGRERRSALGGPFVGAGVGWRQWAHARTRMGWSFYAPDWAEHSLAVELEPGRVQVVPAMSLVSPGVLVLPSAGIGLGLPFRFRPDAAVGARLQASLGFPYVNLLGAIDFFPGDEAWAQPMVMVELSL